VQTLPSSTLPTTPSPSTSDIPPAAPTLTCTKLPVPHHPLLLFKGFISGTYVLDVADPLHPVQVCVLTNGSSARFVSATKIVFWASTLVGTADLETGNVSWSRAWLTAPIGVVFSPDGTNWAYMEADDKAVRTHLVVGGKDTVVVTRAFPGGHGVPPYGPLDQLAFSATGQYLLTNAFFAPAGDPPNFMVFAMDGSTAFKSTTAEFGTWDRAGNRLYFLATRAAGSINGTVESLEPGVQPVVRSAKLSSYFWPTLSPDGNTMVFNSYGVQGFPHPWKLDLARRVKTQLASATSSQPVFISPDVIWSNEGVPCACGPGGTSQPDGRVIAHNLRTGVNSVVLLLPTLTRSQSPTDGISDVWFG
jgi:hypothetical protein